MKIAKGSVGEVKNQVLIALMVGYLEKDNADGLVIELESLSSKIGGFVKYLETKRKNGEFVNK